MGSPDSEPGHFRQESPQHPVEVGRFALGRYEVTIAQWDACVSAGGCSPRPDSGWDDDDTPVTLVSWHDAQHYVRWLSRRTGHAYRLPSEAEWEYAARAGSTTARHWGDEIGISNANCDGCGSPWDNRSPAPVGSFAANDFGIHDMLGNVWEWSRDGYREQYETLPTLDPYEDRPTDLRVLRGGAYSQRATDCRAARRFLFARDGPDRESVPQVGFRASLDLR
jgi:formylglycine-generating enzyme required for sulfatase activity